MWKVQVGRLGYYYCLYVRFREIDVSVEVFKKKDLNLCYGNRNGEGEKVLRYIKEVD